MSKLKSFLQNMQGFKVSGCQTLSKAPKSKRALFTLALTAFAAAAPAHALELYSEFDDIEYPYIEIGDNIIDAEELSDIFKTEISIIAAYHQKDIIEPLTQTMAKMSVLHVDEYRDAYKNGKISLHEVQSAVYPEAVSYSKKAFNRPAIVYRFNENGPDKKANSCDVYINLNEVSKSTEAFLSSWTNVKMDVFENLTPMPVEVQVASVMIHEARHCAQLQNAPTHEKEIEAEAASYELLRDYGVDEIQVRQLHRARSLSSLIKADYGHSIGTGIHTYQEKNGHIHDFSATDWKDLKIAVLKSLRDYDPKIDLTAFQEQSDYSRQDIQKLTTAVLNVKASGQMHGTSLQVIDDYLEAANYFAPKLYRQASLESRYKGRPSQRKQARFTP